MRQCTRDDRWKIQVSLMIDHDQHAVTHEALRQLWLFTLLADGSTGRGGALLLFLFCFVVFFFLNFG
jgi:hypothetical protein